MRRLLLLAVLVPLASGCGWLSAFTRGPATVHPSAPVSEVPRWIKVEHLPKKAILRRRSVRAHGLHRVSHVRGLGQ